MTHKKFHASTEDRASIYEFLEGQNWSQESWELLRVMGVRCGARPGEETLFGESAMSRLRIHNMMLKVAREAEDPKRAASLAIALKALAVGQAAIDASVRTMVATLRGVGVGRTKKDEEEELLPSIPVIPQPMGSQAGIPLTVLSGDG